MSSGQPGSGSDSAGGGHRRIARSAGLVGLVTFASRILGLLRDAVIAAWFRREGTDAFFVALTIPNVFRRLFAEGALSVAFVPVFTQYRELKGEGDARDLLGRVAGATLCATLLTVAAGVVLAPHVVRLFAYGLSDDPATFATATLLTRVVFAFLITIALTALASGALNTYGQFAAPAAAPVVLNLAIIATTVFASGPLGRWWGAPVLAPAVGVAGGGVLQLLLQLPFLRRHGMLTRPRLDFGHEGVRRVAWLMVPSLFALAIYQINVILARQFASFLEAGAISAVYYAQRLIEFPNGIFAVAVATVAMPDMARHAAQGQADAIKSTLTYSVGIVLFIMLPASAGLVALSEPLTAVIFQRGRFTYDDTQRTALTLVGFAVGLFAYGTVRQVSQVFYALQDTRTPVKVSSISLAVFCLSAWFGHRAWATLGLALSVSLASFTNCTLLLWYLRRKLGGLGLRKLVSPVAKSLTASVLCAVAAHLVGRLGTWPLGGRSPLNVVVLAAAVGVGMLVYLGLCHVLRVEALEQLVEAFRQRKHGGKS